MRVKFWGVRGSIAAPGQETNRYGGNTSCVEVTLSDGTTIVLDGGTGLRMMGLDCLKSPRKLPIYVLVSHHHWDHIQGFPFFVPVYDPKAEIVIFPFRENGRKVLFSLLEQMDGAHFPVQHHMVPSKIRIEEPKSATLELGPAKVKRIATNHPGGGWGFAIEHGGHKLVYMTDNELDPPQVVTPYKQLVEFASGADLLVHDAQYVPREIQTKKGWGHSSTVQALEFAREAGAKCLALFHHDPQRTDADLDGIAVETADWTRKNWRGGKCLAAVEGMTMQINSKGLTADLPAAAKSSR